MHQDFAEHLKFARHYSLGGLGSMLADRHRVAVDRDIL